MGQLSFVHNKKRLKNLGLGLIAFSLLIIASGVVFSEEDHDRAKILRERGEIRPLPEIIEKAQKEHPGQIIEVELEEEKGKIIYEVELLDTKGIVWEVQYDAKTGERLSSKQEK